MHRALKWLFCLIPCVGIADTINNYMRIASNVSVMEMKADADAQTWARSAKNVLAITNESIAETLLEANALAMQKNTPLFCLPPHVQLDSPSLKALIEDQFKRNTTVQNEKDIMTVSQVAWLAVLKAYPCHPHSSKTPPLHSR